MSKGKDTSPMVNCYFCRQLIDRRAKKCPSCGVKKPGR